MRILFALGILVALAPWAAAGPLTCADPCAVAADSLGFLPPVVEIADGGRVRWQATDTSHVMAESPILDGESECFLVATDIDSPSPLVGFTEIRGGLLATTNPDTSEAQSEVCGNAIPLEAFAWTLAYHCILHPNMRGELIVALGV